METNSCGMFIIPLLNSTNSGWSKGSAGNGGKICAPQFPARTYCYNMTNIRYIFYLLKSLNIESSCNIIQQNTCFYH